MVEVINRRLLWLPESLGRLDVGHPFAAAERVSALSLCLSKCSCSAMNSVSVYSVPHYTKASCGRAFGPFGLDQLLTFCHELGARLQLGQVVVVTDPDSRNDRANAAVLLGAYLVLVQGRTARDVQSIFGGDDAGRKFVCSFAPLKRPEPSRVLTVGDCWQGLQLARDAGWVNGSSPEHLEEARHRHRILAHCYDAGWLIPQRLMVSADPVTTAHDPNPITFSTVFPQEAESGLKKSDLSFSSLSTQESLGDDSGLAVESDSESGDRVVDADGVPQESPRRPLDWISLLHESNVAMILRTNTMQEPGMVCRSYDGNTLSHYGIMHKDVTLEDGAVPSPEAVRELLAACGGLLEQPAASGRALLVHCKGGFGRSVLMASLLMVHAFDVPGSALLGWVRIARPGAINTHRQEKFLYSLGGRSDLMRYAHGMHTHCGPLQCEVQ